MPDQLGRLELATQARLAANALALGRDLDRCVLAFTIVALAAALLFDATLAVRLLLTAAVVAGVVEKFFALRIAFDQSVFTNWSQRWDRPDGVALADDMLAFDKALVATGRRLSSPPGVRPLDDRIRGAMKLLTYQATFIIIQALALLAAIICRHGS